MKYNVGDKVRIKKNLEVGRAYNSGWVFVQRMIPYRGKTVTIRSYRDENGYYSIVEDGGEWKWTYDMFENASIEAGDKVRIKKECTIEEFTANNWNYGFKDTIKFFKQYGKDTEKTFDVKKVSDRGNIVIEDEDGEELFVNFNVLELAEKKTVKEMTLDEISKALGYEVKIVK